SDVGSIVIGIDPETLVLNVIIAIWTSVPVVLSPIFCPLPFKLTSKPDSIPWFLLPLYKLNKLIHSEVVFISLVVVCALLFVSWPYLIPNGKGEHHNLWQRPIPFAIVVITIIFLITVCILNF
ncbi:MAG: hypothetical protein Q6358_04660, partial [Candidatus Brocadiales bacterium]|nr:hypothetical protein [Candidatus Brocadiales bacterium]